MNSPLIRQFEERVRFISQELRKEIASRNWREPMRPWRQFIARFSLPHQQLDVIYNRIVLNSHIYQSNYVAIVAFALLSYTLINPRAMLNIAIVVTAHRFVNSVQPIAIQGRRLTRSDRYRIFFMLSSLFLSFTGVLSSFLRVVSLTLSTVIAHACLRHTDLGDKISQRRTQ